MAEDKDYINLRGDVLLEGLRSWLKDKYKRFDNWAGQKLQNQGARWGLHGGEAKAGIQARDQAGAQNKLRGQQLATLEKAYNSWKDGGEDNDPQWDWARSIQKHGDVHKAMQDPTVVQQLAQQGFDIKGTADADEMERGAKQGWHRNQAMQHASSLGFKPPSKKKQQQHQRQHQRQHQQQQTQQPQQVEPVDAGDSGGMINKLNKWQADQKQQQQQQQGNIPPKVMRTIIKPYEDRIKEIDQNHRNTIEQLRQQIASLESKLQELGGSSGVQNQLQPQKSSSNPGGAGAGTHFN